MFAARAAGTGLFLHLSDGALYAPGRLPSARPERTSRSTPAATPLSPRSWRRSGSSGAEPPLRRTPGLRRARPPLPAAPIPRGGARGDPRRRDGLPRGVGLARRSPSRRRRPGRPPRARPETLGRTLNLGGGLLVNPRTLLALLAREAGTELRLTVTPPPGPLRPRRPARLSAAREALGLGPGPHGGDPRRFDRQGAPRKRRRPGGKAAPLRPGRTGAPGLATRALRPVPQALHGTGPVN